MAEKIQIQGVLVSMCRGNIFQSVNHEHAGVNLSECCSFNVRLQTTNTLSAAASLRFSERVKPLTSPETEILRFLVFQRKSRRRRITVTNP